MKRPQSLLLTAVLLAALLLASCAGAKPKPTATPEPQFTQTPEPAPTPTPTPEPADTRAELAAALAEVRALIDGGSYYAAFREIVALEDTYREEPERLRECEAVFGELDQLLKGLEPESGTELSRTFAVQGGCVLEISAFSGPALVTVIDEYAVMEGNPNPSAVTFYVRQGELGQTYLPAGTYRIRYQVGLRWFGERDGFGEYRTDGELEPLVFDFYMDGQWASNSKYTITL